MYIGIGVANSTTDTNRHWNSGILPSWLAHDWIIRRSCWESAKSQQNYFFNLSSYYFNFIEVNLCSRLKARLHSNSHTVMQLPLSLSLSRSLYPSRLSLSFKIHRICKIEEQGGLATTTKIGRWFKGATPSSYSAFTPTISTTWHGKVINKPSLSLVHWENHQTTVKLNMCGFTL